MSTKIAERAASTQDAIAAEGSPPSFENHTNLAAWVTKNGGYIHPNLQVTHEKEKGFHAVVKQGQVLSANLRIATCPVSLTLSALNVLNIPPFEQHGTKFPDAFLQKYQFATDILQTFYLMEQHVLGTKSFWHVYLKTLPTVNDVDSLQFESDEDSSWIRGTNLEAALVSQSRKWASQFEEANALLKEQGWASATSGAYDYRLFRWASTIFGSRSFTSKVLDDTRPADLARPLGRKDSNHQLLQKLFSERFAVLVPLLDILNHKPGALVEWQAQPDFVGLQIEQDYKSGEEVFNNYGPRDNEGLLMSYGFVIEGNLYDHVLISINAHPGTPLEIARTWPQDDRSNDLFNCYIFDPLHPIVKEAKYLERALFSYDLLDSISVMISNDREFQAMHEKRQTLMSSCLPNAFDDFHNLLATLAQIMYDSGARAKRIQGCDPSRPGSDIVPQTQKQRNAQTYRRRQVSILQTAEGVCAFALLSACTDQSTSDLLLSMRMRLPDMVTPQLEDMCNRLPCVTARNELFTATSLVQLLPSPTANSLRSCLRSVENAILESVPSHLRMHEEKTKTSFAITLSALCLTSRSETQLPRRISTWMQEMTSSYPPEDDNWNYVPPPGPYAPGEEPPPALMTLLGSIPKVTAALARDSAMKQWLEPKMICWAWNVMEEEGIRVPLSIEKFASQDPGQMDGISGFLLYLKQYA